MTPAPPDPIAPGAASQLLALLATVAGAVLGAALLRLGLWLRHRRRAGAPVAAAAGREADPGWTRPSADALRRLLGAVLAAALLLPTAAALRQLWPHPALGARLIVIWLVLLALVAGAWILGREAGRRGRGRS